MVYSLLGSWRGRGIGRSLSLRRKRRGFCCLFQPYMLHEVVNSIQVIGQFVYNMRMAASTVINNSYYRLQHQIWNIPNWSDGLWVCLDIKMRCQSMSNTDVQDFTQRPHLASTADLPPWAIAKTCKMLCAAAAAFPTRPISIGQSVPCFKRFVLRQLSTTVGLEKQQVLRNPEPPKIYVNAQVCLIFIQFSSHLRRRLTECISCLSSKAWTTMTHLNPIPGKARKIL